MVNQTGYQAVDWNEPIIYDLESKRVDTSTFPEADAAIAEAVGDVRADIPADIRREEQPGLPDLSEPEVAGHYTRLSQQTQGVDTASQIGIGTSTMKYNPKFSEFLGRLSGAADVHPEQPPETTQGYLELMYRLEEYLCEIAGMDAFSLQPRGGAHGILANAFIIRAYHEHKGQLEEKTEIISSVLSHPSDAGAPSMAGFDLVNLYPDDETGIPAREAFEEAVSERTAGMMITNPYDTGKYDDNMAEYIDLIHEVDGIVAVDQANANGLIGKVRIGDIGADLCQFNLHKTFGVPHASYGPASGPIGATDRLAKFLPVPRVEHDGESYRLEYDRPESIGKVGGYHGTAPAILKAYAWIRRMGAEGLEAAAETAVINNNYLISKLIDIPGIDLPPKEDFRIQEARLSLEQMHADTGVSTEDVNRRIVDYGVQNYFTSHEPRVVPEPFTPEPTESVSREELDRWADIMARISEEAYSDPDRVKGAPYTAPIGRIDETPLTDPERTALTWRAYKKTQ